MYCLSSPIHNKCSKYPPPEITHTWASKIMNCCMLS